MRLLVEDVRQNLAYAFNILAMLQLDDHTYTHLSCRESTGHGFHMQPFGLKFWEVRSKDLLTISYEGKILEGVEKIYNKTGYNTHGKVYQSRPDVHAVFHLHTPSIVAVSAMEEGLLPLSQWALHFYQRVGYHDYNSLVLDESEGLRMVQDLADYNVLLMQNHGCLIVGKTIHEAMFYTHHLEMACQTQIRLLSMQKKLCVPSKSVCEKTVADVLGFESDLGLRDWQAWLRQLKRYQSNGL